MTTQWVSPEQLLQYKQQGYAVIPGMFAEHEVARLKQGLREVWTEGIRRRTILQSMLFPVESLFPPLRNVHQGHKDLLNWALDRRTFGTASELLGEGALLVGSTGFYKCPGAKQLPLHQDNYDIGADPSAGCAFWISLDGADPGNGGLKMVPRSHRLGLLKPRMPGSRSTYGQSVPVPDHHEAVDVVTAPGDVVVFHGFTVHGSHANRTRYDFRNSLVLHFVGESVKSLFVQNRELLNSAGDKIFRPVNKSHSVKRLFLTSDSN
ncbi:phytanoyl-CoA dioxygenase family protein [Paenibacillus lutrae]|uniref:Phytanoyl-CoA dioxygenase family protein n=1 Tax=Paenibacillus lutrae TaxID=2078573 RepID=A0A7X3FGB9_9BACL|nr:phytanoyl-CoA dioxygenase family protein [Paenibacillus lutrae]MVO98876.1 phytanoyl-CoA dioxygenase family protein [Paenibacillus lutrae]